MRCGLIAAVLMAAGCSSSGEGWTGGPEEKIVRDTIISQAHDPGSVQFVKWGPHDLKGELSDGKFKMIRVAYRARNDHGTMQLEDVVCGVANGQVIIMVESGGDNWKQIHGAALGVK